MGDILFAVMQAVLRSSPCKQANHIKNNMLAHMHYNMVLDIVPAKITDITETLGITPVGAFLLFRRAR